MIEANINYCDHGGYYVEWINDMTERVCYWFGSYAACNKRIRKPAPKNTSKYWVKPEWKY